MTNNKNHVIVRELWHIELEFSYDEPCQKEKCPVEVEVNNNIAPFVLWRGEQAAIGESMTEIRNQQKCCIGYSKFKENWNRENFRRLFQRIESGILTLHNE